MTMKKLARSTFKFILFTIGTLVALVLLYLLAAWAMSRITIAEETNAPDEVTIYLLTNGVHTDVVVPARNELYDWTREVRFEHTKAGDSTHSWLAMGWGDKGFYLETPTWAELKPSVAFKAAFGISSTAIHATYYPRLTENETCRRLLISRDQYQRLIQYIQNSFRKHTNGSVMPIPTNAQYGQHDAFYEAHGSYSFLHTCNTWANNALKACGQRACFWTPFDTGIFLKYE